MLQLVSVKLDSHASEIKVRQDLQKVASTDNNQAFWNTVYGNVLKTNERGHKAYERGLGNQHIPGWVVFSTGWKRACHSCAKVQGGTGGPHVLH